jgi:hypothetical protein
MRTLWAAVALLCLAAPLEGATLYVNPTHASDSDATTRANNTQSLPWTTVGRAFWGSTNVNSQNTSESAQPGDLVLVLAAGSPYASAQALSAPDEQFPLYNTATTGTAGNIITYRCVADFAAPTVVAWGSCLLTASAHQGPVIGAHNRDYVTLEGFRVDETQSTSLADTGPVTVVGSDHIVIRSFWIEGIFTSFNDNHNGIRVEASDDVLLTNNLITGIDDVQGGENPASIMTYTVTNLTIEYNTIHSGQNGIFIKGSNVGPVTIRFNLIHTQERGIWIGGVGTGAGSDGAYVYGNIVYGVTEALSFISYDAVSPVQVRACNNTLVSSTGDKGPIRFVSTGIAGLDDVKIHGNILSGGQNSIAGEDQAGAAFATKAGPATSALEIEHNVYHGSTTSFSRIDYTNRNFATWKTFTGTDAASPASVESDPSFINAGTNDYRLNSGSPARMAVPDTCDIDADANTAETKDAGARQFADNGAPLQIGHDEDGVVDPGPGESPTDKYRAPQQLRGLRMASLRLDPLWMMPKRTVSRRRW